MTKAKRSMALMLALLAFLLFCCGPLCESTRAIVGVDDAIIAIVIAALAALGITFVTTGAYSTAREYVGSLMQDYASSLGVSVSSQMAGVQTGTNRLSQLLVNNRFIVYLQGFAIYLIGRFSLSNNGSYVLQAAGASLDGTPSYALPISFPPIQGLNYSWDEFQNTVGDAYAIVGYPSSNNATWQVLFWNVSPFTITRTVHYTNGTTDVTQFTGNLSASGVYYYLMTGTVGGYNRQTWAGDHVSTQRVYDLWNGLYDGTIGSEFSGVGINIETTTIVLPRDDADYDEGDGAVIDVGADWGSTYGEVVTGVIPGEFADGKEGEATITYDAEDVVQDQVSDTPSQSVSSEAGEYSVTGLQDVFPFCIPFDLYNFVGCLAADPVAPSFDWRFYVPGIVDETITIDLAPYDTVAQILRTMELLLFCVGLAFVTRKIIRG